MSFFDLFRGSSPTSGWREDRSIPLLADLDRLALNGTGFDDEVTGLEFLGPSDSRGFDYPSKGVQLEVGDGLLEGLVLALRDGAYLGRSDESRVRAFAGRIRMNGRDLAPQDLRAESDFSAAWGEPYWRDEDEDEILLFFELDRGEVQVELSLAGVPQVLVVTPDRLMADPEQRRQYGVTKPWPPEGQWLPEDHSAPEDGWRPADNPPKGTG